MQRTKIQSDRYSLYLRLDGLLFRPRHTEMTDGLVVQIAHSKNQPTLRVIRGTSEEIWYSHGSYLDGAGRRMDSEFVYLGAEAMQEESAVQSARHA